METTTIDMAKMHPSLHCKKRKVMFLILNIYLAVGVASLLATIAFLLLHLDQADQLIRYCIPGFVLCVSSGLFYGFGYYSLFSEHQD